MRRAKVRSVTPTTNSRHRLIERVGTLPAPWRDECGHAAGDAVVAAVGEEFAGVAERAAVGAVDAIVGDAGVSQLQTAGGGEVNMSLAVAVVSQRGIGAKETIEFGQNLGADFKGVD